jgi:hypothetical protein
MVHLGSQVVGRTLAAALRLWLIVCLWPTPLPWVHRHEDPSVDRPRLVAHLQEFHPHEAADAGQVWHLHFAYLWQLTRGESCPDQREQTPPNELPAIPISASSVMDVSPSGMAGPVVAIVDLYMARASEVFATRVAVYEGSLTAFLSSYGGAIAPHQLIGVYLC